MVHSVCCDSYRVYNVTCVYYSIVPILGVKYVKCVSVTYLTPNVGTVQYCNRHKSHYMHGTNHSTHCEPSGIAKVHSHIVKNFMVLSLA